jgi:hypothetical protein
MWRTDAGERLPDIPGVLSWLACLTVRVLNAHRSSGHLTTESRQNT